MSAEVTRMGLLDAQVCVPSDWTDEQARDFLEQECPCGTSHGWQMRRNGHERLCGCDERVQCEQRSGHVHIMFDA